MDAPALFFDSLFQTDNIIFLIFEIAILLSAVFYIVFAFVVLRQVGKMTETLEVGFESPIRFLALTHFLLAIGVFVVALVIL